MIKILHIFDHSIPLHSGYAFRSQSILYEQRQLGWETEHVTGVKHTKEFREKNQTQAWEEVVEGLHFFRTPVSHHMVAKWPVLEQYFFIERLVLRLKEIVPRIRPNILHAHSPVLNGIAALRIANRFKLPLIYEVRAFWEDAAVDHGNCREGDLRYRITRALETYVLQRSGAITCICEGLRKDILDRGILPEMVTVIPNAVDIKKFQSGQPRDHNLVQQLNLSQSTVLQSTVLGFIGSFYGYEGLDLLLQAMPAILAKRPEVKLLLVGGGYEENQLKLKTRSLGLTEQVIFTGRIPHEQIPYYYDLVDLFVYPRLSMRLTELVTPLKPLEAMAQGRLVIASDVGGHRELIKHGETGWLFRAGDLSSLTDTVLRVVTERDYWPIIRIGARLYVEKERSWPVSIEKYRSVYSGLLGVNL